MATTTNYGWTTPDDSSLVKDGAAAIRTLGSSIDTSLNTALGTKKAGMVLLNTTSFSAVASQSFNDVFSATYDNYKIVSTIVGSTDLDLKLRFRVSGADNSTANYNYQQLYVTSTTVTGLRATSQTTGQIHTLRTTINAAETTIHSPFKSEQTSHYTIGYDSDQGSVFNNYVGRFSGTTSFTGFTLIVSGTMTGTVSIYGLAK